MYSEAVKMFAIDFVTSLYRQISGCYKYYIMKLPAILLRVLWHSKDN